jgi:hypothetical protein
MKFNVYRNPGLPTMHLALEGNERTVCKHYHVPRMSAVDAGEHADGDRWCTDCASGLSLLREVPDESD